MKHAIAPIVSIIVLALAVPVGIYAGRSADAKAFRRAQVECLALSIYHHPIPMHESLAQRAAIDRKDQCEVHYKTRITYGSEPIRSALAAADKAIP